MSTPRSRVLAWALFGIFVGVSAAWVSVAALNGESVVENIVYSVAYATFGVIGLLIASRRPENSLGWIFLAIGIGANAGNGASAYAEYALVTHPGSLPLADWAALVGEFLWPTAITSILLLLVLFPAGRPDSAFQRGLLWLALAGIAALNVGGFLLKPHRIPVADGVAVDNPAGLEDTARFLAPLEFAGALIPIVAILAIVALIVQARRSHGVERQQLKWFGYSALAMVVTNFVLFNLIQVLFPSLRGGSGDIVFIAGFSFIPLGTGVAILKYRLYDLERIVNKTLVYGALTAVLAAAYLGLVVLLQTLVEPLTRESDLAVAGSTLAVAAMFRPLRARLQAFIDHRFYRRRYDAQATVENFASRLRDEVDLGSLSDDLVRTVADVMQPTHAYLWLRPSQEQLT